MSTSLISKDNAIALLLEKHEPHRVLNMIKKCLASILIDKDIKNDVLTGLSDILHNHVTTDVRISLVQNFLMHNQDELISQVDTYFIKHSNATLNQGYVPCSEVYEYTGTSEDDKSISDYYETNSKKIIKDLLEIINNHEKIVESHNPGFPVETSRNYVFTEKTGTLKIMGNNGYCEYTNISEVAPDKTNSNFLRFSRFLGNKDYCIIDSNNPNQLFIINNGKNFHVVGDKIYALDAIGTIKRDLKLYMDNLGIDGFAYLTDKFIDRIDHEALLKTVRPKVYYMENNQLMEGVLKPEYNITNLNFGNYRVTKEIKGFMKNSVVQYDKLNLDMFDRKPLEPIYTSPDQSA